MSRTGILLSARQPIDPGTTIQLQFRLSPEDPNERTVAATVVRCERDESEVQLAFPSRIAIEFDEIDEAIERELEAKSPSK